MELYDAFLSKYGKFTEIQDFARGPLEKGENCLIIAPTGSGKTEAVLLPLLDKLSKSKKNGIRVLYITPLRALNRDLNDRIKWLCDHAGIELHLRHGDTSAKEKKSQAESPNGLFIITPETLQNLFLSQRLKNSLSSLEIVIIDEIHELYHNKRGAQLSIALERLEVLSSGFQRIGISATIGDAKEVANFLFNGKTHSVVRSNKIKSIGIGIEIPRSPKNDDKELIGRLGLDKPSFARLERVAELVRNSNSAIIFANTRQVVESLGNKLIHYNKAHDFGGIGIHHGSIDKKDRMEVEADFKKGKIKCIIATSSLELGIDIGSIDLIIQYGSPRQSSRLVQRVGRSGHLENAVSKGMIIASGPIEAMEAASVSKRAFEGMFEQRKVEKCALDVLSNQIIAMVVENKGVDANKAYQIIIGSYVYKDLKREEFDAVVEFISSINLVRYREGKIGPGKGSMEYFFGNISVIPDSSRFLVKNIINNKPISTLDEKFVYNNLDVGSTFITKGLPWKIVDIEEDIIHAEPVEDMEAAIPDWEGEDIPVMAEVVENVEKMFSKGLEEYSSFLDTVGLKEIRDFISIQEKSFVPYNGNVFIEELEDYSILYTPLGKQGNEIIARMLSYIASARTGSRITAKATPYGIIMAHGESVKKPDMKEVLELAVSSSIPVSRYVIGTDLFRYKFMQVAKLFGVVDKKAKISKSIADRVVGFYSDSVVGKETLRDMWKNYFDMKVADEFLKGIRNNTLKVKYYASGKSALAKEIMGIAYKNLELLSFENYEGAIDYFRQRTSGKKMEMVCTYCGFMFTESLDIENDGRIQCRRWKSALVVRDTDGRKEIIEKIRTGKRLRKSESPEFERIQKEASLVSAYGNRALISLSTYGIGIETAGRALSMIRRDKKHFFADLMKAQKNFIKNKKYWA